MMQKVLYALAAAALLSLAHGSPVGDETVVVDDSIQNDAELEMMDAMQDQEHVDRVGLPHLARNKAAAILQTIF